MIKHIVLFRFKSSLNQESINQIANQLLNMGNKISQIKDCKWIVNLCDQDRDHGFKYGISMQFANQKDLDEYIEHPHHVEICEESLFPALEGGIDGLLVFDYKLE